MVTMLFMAVTSAGSAELVAVSSLFTYDLYKTYINKNANGAPYKLPSVSTCPLGAADRQHWSRLLHTHPCGCICRLLRRPSCLSGTHGLDACAGKTIVRMSQYIIVAFGCFMGVMAIILLEIGLNLG